MLEHLKNDFGIHWARIFLGVFACAILFIAATILALIWNLLGAWFLWIVLGVYTAGYITQKGIEWKQARDERLKPDKSEEYDHSWYRRGD